MFDFLTSIVLVLVLVLVLFRFEFVLRFLFSKKKIVIVAAPLTGKMYLMEDRDEILHKASVAKQTYVEQIKQYQVC